MALMKCPECGKDISDKSTVCIQCGFPIAKSLTSDTTAETSVQNDLENDSMGKENVEQNAPNSNTKRRKNILRCLLVIVILFVAFFGYEAIKINKYDNFKGSIKTIQYCKKLMRDPDSFKLEDDIIHVRYKSVRYDIFADGSPYEYETDYYLISYSGTNSYNAKIKNKSMFEKNGSSIYYIGEFNYPDLNNMNEWGEAAEALAQVTSKSKEYTVLYETIDKDSYDYLLTRLFYRH